MAVHEILVVDRNVREMITSGTSIDEIRDYAIKKQRMSTIAMGCISLMEQGETTIQEVIHTAYSNKGGGE
jgi:type IV pilus assembly protein PilB